MDRRTFFRSTISKTTEALVNEAEEKISAQAAHWIRPPYALKELDFLLACTRCGECINACPHQIIFPLAARLGARVVNTPALDLLHHSCHLCEDWPCVQACEVGALTRTPTDNESESTLLPRLASVAIDKSACLPYLGPECGACEGSCPIEGALYWAGTQPDIDPGLCTGCAACREVCIIEPKAVLVHSLYAVGST